MLKMLTLFGMFAATSASVVTPQSGTILFPGEVYDITWNVPSVVNVRFEVYTNNTWVTGIDDSHFLSVLLDPHVQTYSWKVPLYLSQFWIYPCRIVVTDLLAETASDSGNFSISGIRISSPNQWINDSVITINSSINISWTTNTIYPYRLDLQHHTTNYFNYEQSVPYFNIVDNVSETYYDWFIPEVDPNLYKVSVKSTNNKTIGISDSFYIYPLPTESVIPDSTSAINTYSTTSETSTISTVPNTTISITESEDGDSTDIWLPIGLVIGGLVFIIIAVFVVIFGCNNTRVAPEECQRRHSLGMVNCNYENSNCVDDSTSTSSRECSSYNSSEQSRIVKNNLYSSNWYSARRSQGELRPVRPASHHVPSNDDNPRYNVLNLPNILTDSKPNTEYNVLDHNRNSTRNPLYNSISSEE